jgi:hypothetical protein
LGRDVNWSNPLVRRWAATSNSNYFRLAYPGEKPDVALVLSSRRYSLLTKTGTPVSNFFVTAHTDGGVEPDERVKLERKLKDLSIQSRVLALSNPVGEGQALLRLVKIQPSKVEGKLQGDNWYSKPSSKPKPLNASKPLEFKVGEGVQFGFENRSNQTLYLVLLWLAQDGSIAPMNGMTSGASSIITLAPKGKIGSQFSTAKYGINPPAGIETLKLFVSTRPIDSAYLGFGGTERSAVQPPETLSPLDVLLSQAFGTRAEPSPLGPIDFKTWASTTREIRIREK